MATARGISKTNPIAVYNMAIARGISKTNPIAVYNMATAREIYKMTLQLCIKWPQLEGYLNLTL